MLLKKPSYFILFSLLFLYISFAWAQLPFNRNPIFEHINKENGLLQAQVISMCEDEEGYLWFATYGGLHRFDGSLFDYYIHSDSVVGSIADNAVHSVFRDSRNRIWAGSENGLSLFNPETNRFKNYNSKDFGFKNYSLRTITEDREGHLWIATYGGGIACFDPVKEKILSWYKKENNTIDGNYVNTVFCDSKGRIWAGMEATGILLFNKKTLRFEKDPECAIKNTVNSIVEGKDGRMWIGTWTDGLFSYDRATKKLDNFRSDINNAHSIPDQTIRQIALDKSGMLWLATTNGLGYFDPCSGSCQTFRKSKYNPKSLPFDFLWSVMIDSEGIVWVGTFGNGLAKMDANRNRFNIIDSRTVPCNTEFNYVEFMTKDSLNRLWVAANDGGIYVYRPGKECPFESKIFSFAKDKKIRCIYEGMEYVWLGTEGGFLRCSKDLKNCQYFPFKFLLNTFSIFSINEDCDGNLWMGGWNTGLMMLPVEKQRSRIINQTDFIYYNSSSPGNKNIPSDIAWNVFKDSQKELWVALENYLLKLNRSTGSFDIILKDIGNISGILEYQEGKIWLATSKKGLICLEDNKASNVYFLSGSFNVVVYDLVRYKDELWLGTENGLYVFNPDTKKFRQFAQVDGLPSDNFIRNSVCSLTGGSILMGTPNGIIHFVPENFLSDQNVDPALRLSDISLFNESVSIEHATKPILDKSLSALKELTLEYNQNVFSINFSAIQHSLPEKIKFIYKLEGFQNAWLPIEGRRSIASFTNLNPGTYYFKIRTLLVNGNPGTKERSLKLVVLPPWWKTIWFQILEVLLGIGLVSVIFYARTANIRKRNVWLKEQVEGRTKELQEANLSLTEKNINIGQQTEQILEQQKELLDKKYHLEKINHQLEESNEFQQRLIGIIGHDIRGPLHRFSLLLELMDKDSAEFVKNQLKQNAENITALATDLLSWVSLQNNKDSIEFTSFELKQVLEKALKEVEFLRSEKNITFININKTDEQEMVKGVQPVLLSVIRNILLNSLRFSEKGSVIELETNIKRDGFIGMRITDFGKGFNADEVNRIIQGEGLKGVKEISLKQDAGLGLSICYDMLKKTGGWFEAASLPGSGATFFIFVPTSSEVKIPILKPKVEKKALSIKKEILNGKTVLLADDDDELRWTLEKTLSNHVAIHEVRSAEEAIEWLKDNTPDLALLDINMPGLSGVELCKTIKGSQDTAHVPCIIISGQSRDTIRKEAFLSGADAFIPKPFEPDEILLQISNYFENQEKKIKRFFMDDPSIELLTENEFNREFLAKLINLIETNLTSEELNIDFLTREMGMSRSTLYRNLKGITGQSVVTFIKNIRMRKSYLLLKEGKMNMSEIAMETGFNSSSYFATSFKKHFGFSPTEIKK